MNTEQRLQLWDRFLSEWPVERIESMTLAQYVSVENKHTFTYWLETEAKALGSIKGGSSEKFGIYKRANSSKRNGRSNYSHDDTYTWHAKYGEDSATAFANLKQSILAVIKAVKANELDIIEKIDIAPTLKWKVAFIYQNRIKPCVLNIYKGSVLCRAVKNSQSTMAQAYSQLINDMPVDEPIFDYVAGIWRNNQEATEQEIEQLIENMSMEAVNILSKSKLQQLYELTEWAHDAGLDIYPVNIDNQFRIGRKVLGRDKSDATLEIVTIQRSRIKLGDNNYSLEHLAAREEEKDIFVEQHPIDREGYWPADYASENSSYEPTQDNRKNIRMTISSLNKILYGAPGTGKTYHTIEAAVTAAEPDFVWTDRAMLKREYERLVANKRIRFVTFHQSYGYEEFVEGISAKSENGQISYYQKDGVFKRISEDAKFSNLKDVQGNLSSTTVWRYTCEGLRENRVLEHCFKHDIAAFNYPEVGDLSVNDIKQYDTSEFDQVSHRDNLFNFYSGIQKGDLIIVPYDHNCFQAIGVVTGDYEFVEGGLEVNKAYVHQRKVRWLLTGLREPIKPFNADKGFDNVWCAPVGLGRDVQHAIFKFLAKSLGDYVLIIDEINRGNISKIFGELITLIEPSKRQGAEEALEVTLPYSGDNFSVPQNLHIIGTMNTADRSLALMDTALRRRFDFVEMVPQPNLFNSDYPINKDGHLIDLSALLATLNQRISVLLDREHTLGHAFFFPAYNAAKAGNHEKAFEELELAFKNKIIPLLQEYFFEDWNKIRLVLGDNQKDKSLRFVIKNEQKYSALFGGNHELDVYEDSVAQFSLAHFEGSDTVWRKPEAYSAIYNPVSKSNQTSTQSDSEQ